MQKLTATIPHRLTRAEARQRIQEAMVNARRDYASYLHGARDSWNGDRMDFAATAMGQSISGHLLVDDQAVHVEVDLPWLLAMLAGPVKKRLETEGHRLLGAPRPEAS